MAGACSSRGWQPSSSGPYVRFSSWKTFSSFAGGKSAFGVALDKAFGPGTQESVRKLIGELGSFLKLFKTNPEQIRASFADLPKDLERDLGAFGTFLGGWGQEIVSTVPNVAVDDDAELSSLDLEVAARSAAGTRTIALEVPSPPIQPDPNGLLQAGISALGNALSGGPMRWMDAAANRDAATALLARLGLGPRSPPAPPFTPLGQLTLPFRR